ncbi:MULTISPECIES: hypothetical protein [Burkholderia]|nr:hypothetical protein [Burkholderia cepacia]MCA7941471.1 hypothetical protein [Burkholderia cepacia]MCA7976852.1 hypothetical protein [Burkholderia cepacia]MCA8059522.1 hypothetical protein [Burkholderia cepacia]MCA8113407.1 hypothetical protein [Burkholderia cepacia]MCA8133613.1 hypothetical protein [Burkholderia cepacia]
MSAHPAKVALATSATSIAIVFFIGFSLSRPGVPYAAFVHGPASHE